MRSRDYRTALITTLPHGTPNLELGDMHVERASLACLSLARNRACPHTPSTAGSSSEASATPGALAEGRGGQAQHEGRRSSAGSDFPAFPIWRLQKSGSHFRQEEPRLELPGCSKKSRIL